MQQSQKFNFFQFFWRTHYGFDPPPSLNVFFKFFYEWLVAGVPDDHFGAKIMCLPLIGAEISFFMFKKEEDKTQTNLYFLQRFICLHIAGIFAQNYAEALVC